MLYCTMEAAPARGLYNRVRANSMSKLGTATLAIVFLSITGGYLYWGRVHGLPTAVPAQPNSPSRPSSAALRASVPAAEEGTKFGPAAGHAVPPPDAKMTTLRSGEVLDFVADVAKLTNVANLRLRTLEQRNFFGKNAWHLQAIAHTENPLRMVFELDDQFDSYSDVSSFSSLQYEMHLNERGQKMESVQRMTTNASNTRSQQAAETHVPPGTRDPLGFMQFLRTLEWSQTSQTRGPVYDGHKLYDVLASFQEKTVSVTVPAGTFQTSKIEIRVFDQGVELKDAHFVLYLAENLTRTPVLLEAVMPFATARVALAKNTLN